MYLKYVEKPPAIGTFGEEESKLQSFSTNWFAGILLHFTKNAISPCRKFVWCWFEFHSKLDFRGFVLGFGIAQKRYWNLLESSVEVDQQNLENLRKLIVELCLPSTYRSSPLFSWFYKTCRVGYKIYRLPPWNSSQVFLEIF